MSALTKEERYAVAKGLEDFVNLKVGLTELAAAQWGAIQSSPQVKAFKDALVAMGGAATLNKWTSGELSDREFGALFYPVNDAFDKVRLFALDKRLDPVVKKIFGTFNAQWDVAVAPLLATGYVKEPGIPYGLLIAGIAGLGLVGFALWKQGQ